MNNNILLLYSQKSYRYSVFSFTVIFSASVILGVLLLSSGESLFEKIVLASPVAVLLVISVYAVFSAYKVNKTYINKINGLFMGNSDIDEVSVSNASIVLDRAGTSVLTDKLCFSIKRKGVPFLQYLVSPAHITRLIRVVFNAAPNAGFTIAYKDSVVKTDNGNNELFGLVPDSVS